MPLKITPELIPHSQFHTGVWLLPVQRPDWYYFLKKKSNNAIGNSGFISSVDKPLRPLVRWLHKRGIKTTPSCSGHHMAERSLENIYENLKLDKKEISNKGLLLQDIETGKTFLYQSPRYTLPWNRRDFLRKAVVYQRTGVLGIRLPKRKTVKKQIQKLQIPGVSVREQSGILFIFTNNNTGDNRYAWKELTKQLKKIIGNSKPASQH
jgi:hypothetical protein